MMLITKTYVLYAVALIFLGTAYTLGKFINNLIFFKRKIL